MTDSIFKVSPNTPKILVENYYCQNKQVWEQTLSPSTIIESLGGRDLHTAQQFAFNANFLFASKVLFIPNIIHEDNPFCLEIATHAKTIYVNSKPFYNYRIGIPSITNQPATLPNLKKKLSSYYTIIQHYNNLLPHCKDAIIGNHIRDQIAVFLMLILEWVKKFGYSQDLGISKKDLLLYAHFLSPKRKIAIYFPRVYGIPKRIKQYLKSKFKHKQNT